MKIAFLGNFSVDFSSENHHKRSIESLGHEVIAMQEAQVSTDNVLLEAQECDMFIWVHTHGWQTIGNLTMTQVLLALNNANIPTMTYHLDLWFGLQRQNDLSTDEFYRHIGHFFTVDKLMADWFNENTQVKGHYLRAGVFEEECVMLEPNQEPLNDIIFVGSKGYHPEWQWRPQLIEWLAETYGDRFKHFGGDGLGIVRGTELNQLYANTKVVVGDSLVLGFNYPDYWSDRVYETLGRGGFLLMPKIKGLDTEFDEHELATFEFGNFDNLKQQIEFYISNDIYRQTMQRQGFNKVKNNYTYVHRWQTIFKELSL